MDFPFRGVYKYFHVEKFFFLMSLKNKNKFEVGWIWIINLVDSGFPFL